MTFILPDLPYAADALEGAISAETLHYHHDKHHRAYVDTTNRLVEEQGLTPPSLSALIRQARERGNVKLFNQAAQLWNHSFYWQCLAPPTGQRPSGRLAELIDSAFGSTERLSAELKQEAVRHFSNGWAWLILDGDQLKITSLHDSDTPVAYDGMQPLLTLDVWEHAYYIDYRNARGDYADKVLSSVIDWEFVASNLDGKGVSRADQEG